MDRILSGATAPRQSGPGIDDNKRVLRIPQSSKITGASPLNCLISYPGHPLVVGILTLCREAVDVFNNPPQLIGIPLDLE